LAKGAKRETMLSEKRPNQHVKKYERLKNLIFSVSGVRCPAVDMLMICTPHLKLQDTPCVCGDLNKATSVKSSSGKDRESQDGVKVKAAESENVLLCKLVRKVFESNFCCFLWLQHLNSTAPEKCQNWI